MKKIIALFAALGFLTIFAPVAQAATPVIRIIDKPHTNFDGTFRDNKLAQSLLPDGALGKIVYNAVDTDKTWVIDPALMVEIADMADGYTFNDNEDFAGQSAAKSFIFRLTFATYKNRIIALPYGNPDQKLLKSMAPAELRFYSQYGAEKLSQILSREVDSENGWGRGNSRLYGDIRSQYQSDRKLLTGLSTISAAEEITDLRASLGRVLSPELTKKERNYYSYQAKKAVALTSSKLRVVSGRYQITSDNAKLPITLVNSFDTAAVVNVSLIPLNSRIQIMGITEVTIAPKSRQQLLVPVTVIAPGSTLVLAQFLNFDGDLVGEVSKLNLSATIIDSRVAWFTTGAAILLFIGAFAQSIRRIRRGRK